MSSIFNCQISIPIMIVVGAFILMMVALWISNYICSNNTLYSKIYMKEEWKLFNKYLKLDEDQFTVERTHNPYKGYHYTFVVKNDEPNITIEIWNRPENGMCSSIHEGIGRCLCSTFIESKSKALAKRLMSIAEARSQYDPKTDTIW